MQDRWTWKRERNIPRPVLAGNTLSGRRYLIYLCIERIVRGLGEKRWGNGRCCEGNEFCPAKSMQRIESGSGGFDSQNWRGNDLNGKRSFGIREKRDSSLFQSLGLIGPWCYDMTLTLTKKKPLSFESRCTSAQKAGDFLAGKIRVTNVGTKGKKQIGIYGISG